MNVIIHEAEGGLITTPQWKNFIYILFGFNGGGNSLGEEFLQEQAECD